MSADLDGASGTPLHPAARETLLAALDHGYADPRRLHGSARSARLLLDNARAATAEALGVRPDEVTFTPSGTHAVHAGLLGLVRGSRRGDAVVHSAVEHSSVSHAIDWGARSVPVGVDAHVGELDLPDLPLFTDACASMGRLPLPAGWAVAAGSAHKWGGPAGVGVLLVRKGARWRHPFPADDRTDERTVGFENVPSILAAAASLQAVVAERDELNARHHALVDVVRRRVAAEVPDVDVVGDPDDRLPHLVTFSCLYVDGEALVSELDRRGFAIASGSACTASTHQPSHVLAAMGALTQGNVRLSLQRDATREQVDAFCDVLPEVVAELRSRVGL